ncbi:hypothetical protein ABRQ21_01050 [Latilactobacillus sakei]|uniref:hypothetical protein n=1 Tax=Latilactobacillus sakei TaxID=1599 RepID=UPI0035C72B6B
MKKVIISFILLLSLICLAPTATYARAGGASGGGGGSTSSGSFGGSTSTTTDRTTNNYYGRRGYYGPRSFLNNLVFAIFFIVSAFLIIRKKRDWLARRHERALSRTVTIDDATRERFEECFYQIEAAWTTNDLSLVAPLMTPHFQRQQQRILNRYQRQHKHNQLESLTIISEELILSDNPNVRKVLVTAQMRDYFTNDRLSDEDNEKRREATYIERFSEIWEFKQVDGQYLVNHIDQSL